MEQEAQAITEARSTRSGSQESYYSGQITEEQYERQITEVNTVLAHEHGFEAVYQQCTEKQHTSEMSPFPS